MITPRKYQYSPIGIHLEAYQCVLDSRTILTRICNLVAPLVFILRTILIKLIYLVTLQKYKTFLFFWIELVNNTRYLINDKTIDEGLPLIYAKWWLMGYFNLFQWHFMKIRQCTIYNDTFFSSKCGRYRRLEKCSILIFSPLLLILKKCANHFI